MGSLVVAAVTEVMRRDIFLRIQERLAYRYLLRRLEKACLILTRLRLLSELG